MSQVLIEVEHLRKSFGGFRAVDGLSFSVSKGEVLGFLGPNGAGKSTTMKMLTGFLTPSAGRARICGAEISDDLLEVRENIGYLPEGAPAYGDMTPGQFLRFIAQVRGYEKQAANKAIADAVAKTQLQSVLDQPIDTLSKGFKRRVGIAQAILHNPPVLIMDEPTDGLDPNQKFAVRRLITAMAKEKAIIISTHILEEVEAVCTRALIIDQGRIVADGTPAELIARSRYHNAVTLEVATGDADLIRQGLKEIEGAGDISEVAMNAASKRITVFPKDPETLLIDDVAIVSTEKHWPIKSLYAEAGRLDEVFRSLTTSDAGEQGAVS